jgi:hypothetical protein
MPIGRLAALSALILMSIPAAQAAGYGYGYGRSGGYYGRDYPRRVGDRVGRPPRGTWPPRGATRICYNIAGRPYRTTLPRCPIS